MQGMRAAQQCFLLLIISATSLVASAAPVAGINGSIYIPKYSGVACQELSNGIVVGAIKTVNTLADCQAIAVNNGHAYYSFHEGGNATSHCTSAKGCDVRSASPGWTVYKRWLGAFNTTHADLVPASENHPFKNQQNNKSCLTEVNVPDRPQPTFGCTSCQEGYMFTMKWHKARAGMCFAPPPDGTHRTQCAMLNSNYPTKYLQGDFMCTKIMLAQATLSRSGHSGEGSISKQVLDHVGSKVGGWGLGNANVVRCEFRKETVCINGECDEQKSAQCKSVCKVKEWKNPVEVEGCTATACETPDGATEGLNYGAMLCEEIVVNG